MIGNASYCIKIQVGQRRRYTCAVSVTVLDMVVKTLVHGIVDNQICKRRR